MSAVTGISGIQLSAASAAYAPTNSAEVSAIASSYAESAMSSKLDESATADFYSTSNPSGFITGVDLSDYATTAYVDSSVSGKQDASAMSDYQPTSAMTAYQLSGDYYSASNPSGFITGVDLSDYATTAYVDSSVSGKLDTTAFNSGDFYCTSNPSGFIDSAYVDSAVSSKADSSAMSSYVPYSSLEYNTASAISGINGSALAAGSTYSAGEGIDITDDVISVEAPVDIVAGPGIVIDNPDGNTLRVSVDQAIEVTLYEDSTGATSVTLSESYYNFERVRFTYLFVTNLLECTIPTQSNISILWLGNTMYRAGDGNPLQIIGIPVSITNNGLTATTTTGRAWWYPGNAGGTINALKLVKVVGIHRIANN